MNSHTDLAAYRNAISSEPYDINFAYPLHPETLTSPRVRLAHFVPALHADTLWAQAEPHANELFRFYPFFPGTRLAFLASIEYIRQQPHWCIFTIFDRTREGNTGEDADGDGAVAGLMALVNTNAGNLSTEIAYVLVLPAFQHTHVARTAAALLLRYCLQTPDASPPGLGFRRVIWTANPHNAASIGLARRVGFREEGILRWTWALPDVACMRAGGNEVRRRIIGDDGSVTERSEGWGRDSVLLAVCWDDWDDGVGERVRDIIDA
ncbi:acyl-CoA N-acyltransferase [Wolfiporia cocos MD-104 SS10]|uniref:Acyl-CoA N-acyltransferase n=1 Tax=Wolfiporia cocos (strain MD-104) TaxID=742152 RepID=A0A2H3JL39_WOLCO|nr:acyl-CoA N-acyltransferase [Wolfiporia cocos MD-104 SS10]